MKIALTASEMIIVKAKGLAQAKKRKPNGVCTDFTAISQKEQSDFAQPIINSAPFVMKGVNRELAKDYVSAAFAKYWANPTAYNPAKSNFRTFIFNSAQNLAIDERRTKAERTSRLASVKLSETDADGENVSYRLEKFLADNSADFEAGTDKTDKINSFMEKVNTLPDVAKNVVLMKLGGFKGQEIADKLNITLSNVKVTQNRAFHKMGMSHVLDNLKKLSQGYKEEKEVFESSYMSQKEIDELTAKLA